MVTAVIAAYFYLRVAVLMYAGGGLGETEGGTSGSASPPVPVGAGTTASGNPLALEAALERAAPEEVSAAVTTLNEQILLSDEEAVEPVEDLERVPVPALTGLAIWTCVGVTVLFGVWPQPLIDFANQATLLFLPK